MGGVKSEIIDNGTKKEGSKKEGSGRKGRGKFQTTVIRKEHK